MQADVQKSMSSALSGFGGYLRCETCLTELPLGDPGRRVAGGQGWPKCCGYTMRWWTQSQIDAGEVSPPEWIGRSTRETPPGRPT